MSEAGNTYAYVGQRELPDATNDTSSQMFVARSLINEMATVALVRVTEVLAGGITDPVGFLHMQPLVHQINGPGDTTPHGIINNVPYLRVQGGDNAVIIDPKVGDIGIAVFCSRDSTAAKNARGPAPPGSRRKYDMSDGLYIGGVRNGPANQYVRFADDGIHIVTPNAVIIDAPNVTLDVDGNLAVKGEITRGQGTGDKVTLGQHRHGTGSPALGTAVPTPGI